MKFHKKSNLFLSLVFFLSTLNVFSQDEQADYFLNRFNGGLRMSVFKSVPMGDNILGSGHKTKGLGVDFGLVIPITPYGFGLGMGYQTVSFAAVAPQYLGEINRSVVDLYYFQAHYQHSLENNLILEVAFGGGPHRIKATTGNITGQNGTGYKLGFNAKYRHTKNFEVVAGIQYVHGQFSVETPKEFNKYFNRTHQLQLHLGFTLF